MCVFSKAASVGTFLRMPVLTGGLVLAAGVGFALEGNAEPLKVGVIAEARASDQPWSAAIADAINAYTESHPDVEAVFSYDAYDPTTAEPVARQLIDSGANVLVMHSFALNDVAHKLSAEMPDIPMSVSSFDPPVQPNLSIATASYLQIGYSNCFLLAKLSKSHTIGYIGPIPIPYSTELLKGCELGAAAANPDTKVLSAFSNTFSDLQATREQAQVLVDQGADALFPASATEDSLGGFQLCEQRQIPCAGWASDIRRFAPNYGVASAILDWSGPLEQLIDQSQTGDLMAQTFNATFGNGGLSPQDLDAATAAVVTSDIHMAYLDVVNKLRNGEVDLPKSEAHPCCE